jgi:hypothetical protein
MHRSPMRIPTFAILLAALPACYFGTPPAPYFARNAKEPEATYRAKGTVLLMSEQQAGIDLRTLKLGADCVAILADPAAALRPEMFEDGGYGVIAPTPQPVETGAATTLDRSCGAVLLLAHATGAFGTNERRLPPTYLVWDRAAVAAARAADPATADKKGIVRLSVTETEVSIDTDALVTRVPAPPVKRRGPD